MVSKMRFVDRDTIDWTVIIRDKKGTTYLHAVGKSVRVK